MRFRDWQNLDPAQVSAIVHQRAAALSPQQRRAVLSWLLPEEELAGEITRDKKTDSALAGLPYLLKDLFDVKGRSVAAGSTFLPEVRAPAQKDGSIVEALRKAGTSLAGVTHLHEFAYGITGENPHHGDCEHPGFPGRTSGGSSSGSAVAVAAGIVPFSIGTDTGGSIRVPAAFCGLFGFRMIPHHAWIADGFPLAPSYDTAGWFTAHAEDMGTMLGELLGSPEAGSGGLATSGLSGGSLELPGLDLEVSHGFAAAAGRLTKPVGKDTAHALLSAFAGAAEVYAVLGGVETWQIHRSWAARFASSYDPVVKARLDSARALSELKISAARDRVEVIKKAWADYFSVHDYLVLPGSPCGALLKTECNPVSRGRILSLTTPVSLVGYPALALPFRLPSGLTSAVQVVARDLNSPVFRQALVNWPSAAQP